MKTDAAGTNFIANWEESGKPKTKAYDDGTGTWTIGFGHTTAAGPPEVHKGSTITVPQAYEILASDLRGVEADVNRLVKVKLNQNQFNALVSFHFNTGALAKASLLEAVNSNASESLVRHGFELFNKAHIKGVLTPLKGLTARRKAEADLFFTAPKGQEQVAQPAPQKQETKMGNTAGEISDALSKINTIAQSFGGLLRLVPGLGQYVGLIQTVLPKLIEAANAVEQRTGQPPTSQTVIQRVADHVDPTKPADPVLSA